MKNDPLPSEDRAQQNKLLIDTRGHVLLMGLNRPEKRNAFDLDLYRELSGAYGELHRNPDLRCGVLYARGDHFTAGLDLPEWRTAFQKDVFLNCLRMAWTLWVWIRTGRWANPWSWRSRGSA